MKNNLSFLVTLIAVLIGGAIGKLSVKSLFQNSNYISFEKVLIETSKQLNETLPIQVDEETRLDTTTAGPGKILTYYYTLITINESNLAPTNFVNTMKSHLVNGYKNNQDMATFRNNKVELHYNYSDKEGRPFANIIISPNDF